MAKAKQSRTWAEVQVKVDSLSKQVQDELPPPPVPSDSWSEKVNILTRALEGMREQVRSEVENEDRLKEEEEA